MPVDENPAKKLATDLQGRLVRTLAAGRHDSGAHRVTWDGTDARGNPVASGVYFCRLEWGGRSDTKRIVLVR